MACVEADEQFTKTDVTSVEQELTKTKLTSVEEDFGKEGDSKREVLAEDVFVQKNMKSAKDLSAIVHNNEMEQNKKITFENHVDDTSSSYSQAIVEDALSSKECGRNENNSADMIHIEEDFKNDGVNMQLGHGKEMKQNPGMIFENLLVEDSTASNSQTAIEDDAFSSRGNNNTDTIDIQEDDVVRSIKWVQIESNVVYIGKVRNYDFVSMPLQHENGMEENPEMVFENHADDTSTSNLLTDIEDGVRLTSVCEDFENNNVDINIEDDSNRREGELIENNVADIGKGLNDDSVNIQLRHDNAMEQNPAITFEKLVVEDSTTSNSQTFMEDALNSRECGQIEKEEDFKNDDVTSREWLHIESNLAYIGKDVNNDFLKTQVQHDNEREENPGMAIENHVDDTSNLTSQKAVEDGFSSKECKDVENKLPDINIQDDLKNDGLSSKECVQIENRLADSHIGESVKNDGLSSAEGELIQNNMQVDFGENVNNDFVNLQLQHEREMEELRIALQDEYQKQVFKISDELRDHYQNDMDEKIAKLEEDWELEFTKQKREFDEQVSAVQREQWSQCQEAIERVTLDAEDQLKNMKYSYERETAEHKQRIKELLEREALWEMKEKELANEKSQKENESFSKIKKLENQLSFEREEVESQLNGTQDEIKTLKKQHESEIESLKNELDKQYSDIVDEMRKELKSKYQNEMDRKVNQVECHLREQYEEDLEKNKEEVQESTSTLKTKYEKQVTEILVQLEELHERNQQHELREARLKKNFESETRKVAELLKEVEGKTKIVRDFEQNKEDLKSLEEKFKQCLNEKCTLEEKVKEYSESMAKETIDLQEELARKSEVIHEMEQHEKDSKNMFDELQERLQKVTEEKDSLEKKLNEDLKSEKLNVEALRKKLEMKEQEINRLQQKEAEYKEAEDKVREISQEKLSLEQALGQTTESQNKEVETSQQELQRKQNEMQELGDKINDHGKKNDEYEELEIKLHEMTIEKQFLEQQLVDSKSEISSLQEKLKEDENIPSELKSNYDTKILQIKRNFEEEVNALENELKLKKNSEEEALRFKKDVSGLKEEVSKLNEELQKHKATISELEETSRSRELEIANLILNSPSPQGLSEQKFDFSANSSDRTQQLENELAKYKKKVQELEEEAEDKFETTLCPNCQDREKSEEIVLQTKALVDKIQLDCKKKVQSVSRDLEKTEKALQEQIEESEGLKAKLAKAEEDLREERKRSLEISKLGKTFDVNGNETSQDIPNTKGEGMQNDKMKALKSPQFQPRLENDKTQDEDSASELPNNKDFESLFDEQEKFYKTKISRKDDENSKLMIENEKIQQQVQNLKEKLDEGAAQYEQLRVRTLEQKTKYENEIKLMQNEIKMLIQENNEMKHQLERLQNIQKETENLQTKFQESENVVQAKFQETKDLQAKLQETENMLKENSSKHEKEIVILKDVVQEKENRVSDLRNSLELLEKSREGLELDISNQKQEFSERERNLLHEIQEMTAAFENEKTKILEDSFLGKGEMKRVDSLEMLIHEYNFDTAEGDTNEKPWQFGGYRGVDMDNLPKESIDIRGHEGVDRDSIPKEWTEDAMGKLTDMRSHEGINWDNLLEEHTNHGDIYGYERLGRDNVPTVQTRGTYENPDDIRGYEGVDVDRKATEGTGIEMQPTSERGQYEEINYYPSDDFKYREEALSDNDEGVLKIGQETKRAFQKNGKYKQETRWEMRHEVLEDAYAGFDDVEFNSPFQGGSPESLFSDGKYKEIGGEENLELLKYEHDIDLLLERNENERLRAEIETLTHCVDVFHDECESLKRSLDKTLDMVERLRDERDGLMKEHDLNMAEHSELMFDLIKNEETIGRLERGNEKLEDDRKILEECLMEKQVMSSQESRTEKQARSSYNPKTKANYQIQDDRPEDDWKLIRERRTENEALFSNNPKAEHSMQLGSEVGEFPRKDIQFLRKSNNETEFLRKDDEYLRSEPEFLRKEDGYQRNEAEFLRKSNDVLERTESLMLEDLVKEAELERRSFPDDDNEDIMRRLQTRDELLHTETFKDDFAALLPDRTEDKKNQRQDGNRKSTTQEIEMQFAKDNEMLHKERAFGEDFAGTLPSVDSSRHVKKQRQGGNRKSISQDNEGYHLRNKSNLGTVSNHSKRSYEESQTPPQHTKTEENRSFSKYRPQASPEVFTPQRSTREMKSLRGTKQPEKPKFKTNSTSVHVEEKRRSNLLQEKVSRRQTSKSKNGSITFPKHDKVSYNSRDALEVLRNETPSSRFSKGTSSNGITGHQKSLKSNSRNASPKSKRVPGSPLSNGSTLNSPNFSSSSILTSTRANLTTTDRLVPNLSGLSPIVSPLDRHYHAEKLKWQISAEDRSNTSRANHDNTTFLLNVDPNGFLGKGFHSSRFKSHNRSRSADDRLLTPSREMTLSRDLYQEKPLIINFEDFVFRHRVKSSEDVANIRDPSPAELWFS